MMAGAHPAECFVHFFRIFNEIRINCFRFSLKTGWQQSIQDFKAAYLETGILLLNLLIQLFFKEGQ